ncbi:MAG TPA: L,D-transpeptidase family protein [Chitinispirillaceae bacterium]|nr:L,D-transpeptidase family protein [Chitinispirillaceae bacterium]
MIIRICAVIFTFILFGIMTCEPSASEIPTNSRAERIMESIKADLLEQLYTKNLKIGSPVFIRIFKKTAILELWIRNDSGQFTLFETYDICYFSGLPGPKLREGDLQSPEGFYKVTCASFNPYSDFYLSINIDYPNSFDRYYKRTGGAIMIHGDCISIGCFAMTDENMGEIYTLAAAAIRNGQVSIDVHSFPFSFKEQNLQKYEDLHWYTFWSNLKQ